MPRASLALPVTVTPTGKLTQCDPWEALQALVAAMFTTSSDAWPHAPWFGLNEMVASSKPDKSDIADALNVALARLEIRWTRVAEVVIQPAPGLDDPNNWPGARTFTIEFVGAHEPMRLKA